MDGNRNMKHIKIYEDSNLIKDMESIGFKPYVGFIFNGVGIRAGTEVNKNVEENKGFLVQAKDAKRCTNIIAQAFSKFIGSGYSSFPSDLNIAIKQGEAGKFNEMRDYLSGVLFESGYILDAGYYGTFKARENVEKIVIFSDPYMMNVEFVYNLAKENFVNYKEIFKKDQPWSIAREMINGIPNSIKGWDGDKFDWK
jgi:hypothetical protein